MPDLTPLGKLLEDARTQSNLSIREAARRAGVSDAHWRQVVSGYQTRGGVREPVRPTPRNLAMMAAAVGADPVEAFRLAGFEATADAVSAALATPIPRQPPARAGDLDVEAEIARIKALPIAMSERWAAIRALLDMVAEAGDRGDEEQRPAG